MKREVLTAAVLALAAGCAQTSDSPGTMGNSAEGSGAPAGASSSGIEGLRLAFFRCDNNAAFTVQNYMNGSVRVTTRAGTRYDLTGADGAFAAGGVSYARQGDTATLTGAAGGPYTNCKRG